MKILITGGNGQLALKIQQLVNNTDIVLLTYSKGELDIANVENVYQVISTHRPDVIINCAAYTNVELAENHEQQAMAVNATGAGNIASVCQIFNIPLIHISTDYVFDGTKSEAYEENDDVNPLSVYGKTKLAGEQLIRKNCTQHIILRTSWLFSEFGNNFLKTMLKLGDKLPSLSVINDQFGNPTYAGDIASAILKICEAIQLKKEISWGIYHYSGQPCVSWHSFAQTIFTEAYNANYIKKMPTVTVISTVEYGSLVTRPQKSELSCEKIQALGISPANWQESLSCIFKKRVNSCDENS